MKQSYYTAPRTLSDATFLTWGEAIEPVPKRSSHATNAVVAVLLVAGLAAVVLVFGG